jgi:hypothetical protein
LSAVSGRTRMTLKDIGYEVRSLETLEGREY